MEQIAFRSTVGCVLTENVHLALGMKTWIVVIHVPPVHGPAVQRLAVVTQGTLGLARNIYDRHVMEREKHAPE